MNSNSVIFAVLLFTAIACSDSHHGRISSPPVSSSEEGSSDDNAAADAVQNAAEDGAQLAQPDPFAMRSCSIDGGKRYKGFGDTDLVAGRVTEVPVDMNRFRIKPLDVFSAELQRVAGLVPPSLEKNRATFVEAGPRWYVEPKSSGVTIFTTYRIAYEAGLTYAASNPLMSAAPTEETATEVCTSLAQTAWYQAPSAEQVAACKKVALIDTASETDIKARWAYTIASILTASEFINY